MALDTEYHRDLSLSGRKRFCNGSDCFAALRRHGEAALGMTHHPELAVASTTSSNGASGCKNREVVLDQILRRGSVATDCLNPLGKSRR